MFAVNSLAGKIFSLLIQKIASKISSFPRQGIFSLQICLLLSLIFVGNIDAKMLGSETVESGAV